MAKKPCPKCGKEYAGKKFDTHMEVCAKDPGRDELLYLWNRGDPVKLIAREIGVSHHAIYRWLDAHDIHQPRETAMRFFQAGKPELVLRQDLATGIVHPRQVRRNGCKRCAVYLPCMAVVHRGLVLCEIPDVEQVATLSRDGLDVKGMMWEQQWQRFGG